MDLNSRPSSRISTGGSGGAGQRTIGRWLDPHSSQPTAVSLGKTLHLSCLQGDNIVVSMSMNVQVYTGSHALTSVPKGSYGYISSLPSPSIKEEGISGKSAEKRIPLKYQ